MDIKYANYLKDKNNDNISFIPPKPTENMRGGITAKKKTNESVEVVIDEESGKAFVPEYPKEMIALTIEEIDEIIETLK